MQCLLIPQAIALDVNARQADHYYRHTWDSNKLQSIQTPCPVFSLDKRPAMMAPCVYSPVAMSVAATPTLQGGPSGSPVLFRPLQVPCHRVMGPGSYICMSPASASTITSYPAALWKGPVWPYPMSEAFSDIQVDCSTMNMNRNTQPILSHACSKRGTTVCYVIYPHSPAFALASWRGEWTWTYR